MEKFEFMKGNPTLLRERFITEAAQQQPESEIEEAVGTVPVARALTAQLKLSATRETGVNRL